MNRESRWTHLFALVTLGDVWHALQHWEGDKEPEPCFIQMGFLMGQSPRDTLSAGGCAGGAQGHCPAIWVAADMVCP